MTDLTPPRVLFLGSLYAGHRTRFINMREHTAGDTRIRPEYRTVSGWVEGGLLERLPFVPRAARGRIRAMVEAAAITRLPRPDVIWTSVDEVLAPYFWSQLGPLRRPLVMDLDSSPDQLEQDARLYFGRAPRTGARHALADLRRGLVWPGVTRFAASSEWAAAGLERMGIHRDRIRVLPPGIDLDAWQPASRRARKTIRLLFVGADFERKGGPMLLEAIRSRSDRYELDIVTHAEIPPAAWYRVHKASPNSALLRRLYAEADIFVLPTRAECFGVAAIEAMASGLPVVMGDVGATREIIDDGITGFVIPPRPDELARVLDAIALHPDQLEGMGRRARSVAEERFDGRRNDGRMVDLLLEEHERFREGAQSQPITARRRAG